MMILSEVHLVASSLAVLVIILLIAV
jgi:hypothetical protein